VLEVQAPHFKQGPHCHIICSWDFTQNSAGGAHDHPPGSLVDCIGHPSHSLSLDASGKQLQ